MASLPNIETHNVDQRTALVTGATGGLGRHLVPKLVAAGYRVRANGRNAQTGTTIAGPQVEFVAGDLGEPGLADRLMRNVDVVFHCAALSAPWGKRASFIAANVTATQELVDAAKSHTCKRFVHVSSPSVTFRFADQLAITEDAPLPRQFANDYAATKAASERIVLACANSLKAIVLRPRGLFGEYDTVLVPRLLHIARGGRMPVFNGGSAIVDVTYAGNVADVLILCDAPGAPPGVYNITNDEPVSVRDLLTRVFKALGRDVRLIPAPYRLLHTVAGSLEWGARTFAITREPPILRYSLGLMRYSQTLDIAKARTRLSYSPAVTIDEGLARFARWHQRSERTA